MERRLAWDYIGGGAGGAPEQGYEPQILNPNDGVPSGPWGHKVSNRSVEGAETAFLDFFLANGGETSFGVAKSDARIDTGAPDTLFLPNITPGFVRQYFQGGVLEFHPDSPERVMVALIGYQLRARLYPDESWQPVPAFADAPPPFAGAAFPLPAAPPAP